MVTYTPISTPNYNNGTATLTGTNGGDDVTATLTDGEGTGGFTGFGYWLGDVNAGDPNAPAAENNRSETLSFDLSRPVNGIEIDVVNFNQTGGADGDYLGIEINGVLIDLEQAFADGYVVISDMTNLTFVNGELTSTTNAFVSFTITITPPAGVSNFKVIYDEKNVTSSGGYLAEV